MITCYILDDQYGWKIYKELKELLPNWSFPIKENINNPLIYLDEIVKKNPEYILLDNYFPGETREEALGETLLEQLLKKKLKANIICISDYGQKLMEKYFSRETAYQKWMIKGRISSKNWAQIAKFIEENIYLQ